jgi:hypothetical protein
MVACNDLVGEILYHGLPQVSEVSVANFAGVIFRLCPNQEVANGLEGKAISSILWGN